MTGQPASPFRAIATGLELRIRLTPKASADRIDGVAALSDGSAHIAARVRAVPEKGSANTALERLVADWLDVGASSVRVAGGATSRLKTVEVRGDAAALAALLQERLLQERLAAAGRKT